MALSCLFVSFRHFDYLPLSLLVCLVVKGVVCYRSFKDNGDVFLFFFLRSGQVGLKDINRFKDHASVPRTAQKRFTQVLDLELHVV